MADEIRFAPKDAKIIKDNPGKSPYELKELGLSDPGFEKLMALESTAKNVIADENLSEESQEPDINASKDQDASTEEGGGEGDTGDKPKSDIKNKLIPKLETPTQSKKLNLKSLKDQVWVQTPSGKRNTMGKTFALKLIRQDPRYKIIG